MKNIVAIVLGAIAMIGIYVAKHEPKAASPAISIPAASSPVVGPATAFNKSAYSKTDPASIWVVVNKQHRLAPADYAPSDLVEPSVALRSPGSTEMQLRAVAASALKTMFDAAKTQGISLKLSSGYRSFATQSSLYNYYVKVDGQTQADKESARPGYSEHQTGWAADIIPTSGTCAIQLCFGAMPEGKWLSANSYKYGFIIRYSKADQSITGYEAEPWHIRYVGKPLSIYMHDNGVTTLESFFGISGGSSY